MTEIEKIEYAKNFIDKLANGINPLDDTPVKKDDVVNNVRLTRCFFFVSDILRQVIENGGAEPKRKKKSTKLAFYLSPDQLADFVYSNKPVSISEIATRLNELRDTEDMKKINHRHLTSWLIEIGMLKEETDVNGKTVKRPTENGNELGIFIDERQGRSGEYIVTVYNLNAQAFIIDNMESIMAFNEMN